MGAFLTGEEPRPPEALQAVGWWAIGHHLKVTFFWSQVTRPVGSEGRAINLTLT